MKVRRIPDELVFALVAANNERLVAGVGSSFHKDKTPAVPTGYPDYRNPSVARLAPAAAATDAATQLSLANNLKRVVNLHFADRDSHNSAISAAIATADATDAATARTLANAIKAAYNTHLTASNVHYNNDTANAVSSLDATDAATLQTLVNEIRTDLIAHMASAPAGAYISIDNP